jgi:hypothetical protein
MLFKNVNDILELNHDTVFQNKIYNIVTNCCGTALLSMSKSTTDFSHVYDLYNLFYNYVADQTNSFYLNDKQDTLCISWKKKRKDLYHIFQQSTISNIES